MAITLSDPTVAELKLSDLVDIVGFAQMCDPPVQPLTIHAYRKRPDRYAVPEPVAYIGNVPVWTRDQVTDWIAARPGQGARSDLVAS